TKHVLERRENSNPRFTEYEYRIRKTEVCKLLSNLPVFPYYQAKGAKGKEAPTQTGVATASYPNKGNPSPNRGGDYPNGDETPTQTGVISYPNGYTSQVATQILSQESSQQQKRTPTKVPNEESASAATPFFLQSLSEEEIALIQALRKKQAQEQQVDNIEEIIPATSLLTSKQVPSTMLQTSEQGAKDPSNLGTVSVVSQSYNLPGTEQSLDQSANRLLEEPPRPQSDCHLTDELVVQLWERLRQVHYSEDERKAQLRAAQELLRLRLPISLSLDLLERVYTTFLDDFWRRKFRGIMNVSHLVNVEISTGQIRIVRWLTMLQEWDHRPFLLAPSVGLGACANGVDYNALTGLTEDELCERGRQQRERNNQRYVEAGLDQEAFMRLSPAERIAVMKKLREEGKLVKTSTAATVALVG
ncbi:MAG: hypothetical protein ACRDHZ_17700, partial [Ktedonobacteraceae bacterium]